jgi:hypothetical protein
VQKQLCQSHQILRIFLIFDFIFFKINIFRQWVAFNSSNLANSSWMIAGVATTQKWGAGKKKKKKKPE